MQTGAVIVAAGLSSRMGDFKHMLNIGSISIAQRVIATLRQAGVGKIVVVTGLSLQTDEVEKTEPAPAPAPVWKIGGKVKVRSGAKTYTGGGLASFVYSRVHVITQLEGNRAVIAYNGTTVAAVNTADLIKA